MNRTRMLAWVSAPVALILSCATPPPAAEGLQLKVMQVGAHTKLALLAASGLKVNARLKPALELPDGRVVRFDSPRLTPDSAYFAEPPVALLPGRREQVRGMLRASVCDTGATVCRTVEVRL